jgi:hypothetical protein
MTALIVFSGHLKGACKDTRLLEHFSRQCDHVFGACEKVLVTYTMPFGASLNGARRTPTHQLSHAQCLRRIRERVHFDAIETVEETTSPLRADRYHQMVSSILLGMRMARSQYAVALRMRPDSGLGGINGILSNATWCTLLDIPADTVVQYGTYQGRDGDRVNGDNVFAARSGTFARFVRLWGQEVVDLLSSGAYEHAELTMNTVARRHNLTLAKPPPACGARARPARDAHE